MNLRIASIKELKRRPWDPVPRHGGPDPDRPVVTLADMTDAWLLRTYYRNRKRRPAVAAIIIKELASRGIHDDGLPIRPADHCF